MTLTDVRSLIKLHAKADRALVSQRFFKTGVGEYGEGDVFAGLTVPEMRKIALRHVSLSLADIKKLLESEIHEERFIALEILVAKYAKADTTEKKKLFEFYLSMTHRINNWDLVDTSAHYIAGEYLDTDTSELHVLARSDNLWERRIAIVATYAYIKRNSFETTFEIVDLLMQDKQDLIHKACGWMLREVGKRDGRALRKYLKTRYKKMPRTMLRYTIERFPEKERKSYLQGAI